MANVAKSLSDIRPTKIARLEYSTPISAQNILPKIPQVVEADILKYLKFEDLKHQDVFKGNLMIPEESIDQFMGERDFDEPIRHIFRDFGSAGVDDRVRLGNLS